MEIELRIDKLGRVVIPKLMRDELGIQPGDRLKVVLKSRRLELWPASDVNPMRKEHGIWVYYPVSAEPVDSDDVLAEVRRGRTRRLAG